ncbi:MAG: cytochrome c, partial [Candidatus Zixiibacteriota bacterium]
RYDRLAEKIAATITVNKSLAVVLGVGPLLCISLVYTTHFYAANAMTGYAWISVVPLVTLAFLLSYLHKYKWDAWRTDGKRFHAFIGVASAVLFLSVPLIFLANINLMLFPAGWTDVRGFFSSLTLGNVFPRYFHFLAASIAVTALFLAGWFTRKGLSDEKMPDGFSRGELRRLFFRIAFYVTLAQLIFGPLLLFTLPHGGLSTALWIVILSGAAVAIAFLWLLGSVVRKSDGRSRGHYIWLWGLLSVVVAAMATGRHLYRETSLAGHRTMIKEQSARFRSIAVAAQMRVDAGLDAGDALGGPPTGKHIFKNCAACHALDRVLAAPSLVDISSIYLGDPAGIVAWAKAPGKKRPEFAPMPSFAHLGDEQLMAVAEYILQEGAASTSDPSN